MAPSTDVAVRIPNKTLMGVSIRFKNFSGAEGKFNPAGARNFAIFLTPEQARELEAARYPVKYLEAREEGDVDQAFIKVKIKFTERAKPPKFVIINTRGQLELTEDMLSILDWADFDNVDVIIRAYEWDFNGKQGVTAYAVTLYATIREDELEQKYANVPIDSAQSAITGGQVYEGELEDLGELDEQRMLEA